MAGGWQVSLVEVQQAIHLGADFRILKDGQAPEPSAPEPLNLTHGHFSAI